MGVYLSCLCEDNIGEDLFDNNIKDNLKIFKPISKIEQKKIEQCKEEIISKSKTPNQNKENQKNQ